MYKRQPLPTWSFACPKFEHSKKHFLGLEKLQSCDYNVNLRLRCLLAPEKLLPIAVKLLLMMNNSYFAERSVTYTRNKDKPTSQNGRKTKQLSF